MNAPTPRPTVTSQEDLCLALETILCFGFKHKNRFGPNRHVWDFVVRAQQQLRSTELASDPESVLTREVDYANSTGWPKSARLKWLICTGASHHVLHVWFSLLSKEACVSSMYENIAVFRCPDRVATLTDMIRYLVEFPIHIQVHAKEKRAQKEGWIDMKTPYAYTVLRPLQELLVYRPEEKSPEGMWCFEGN